MKKSFVFTILAAALLSVCGCKEDPLEKMKETTCSSVPDEPAARKCVDDFLLCIDKTNKRQIAKLLASGNSDFVFGEDGLLAEGAFTPATIKKIVQIKLGNTTAVCVTISSIPRKCDFDITLSKKKGKYLIQSVFPSQTK